MRRRLSTSEEEEEENEEEEEKQQQSDEDEKPGKKSKEKAKKAKNKSPRVSRQTQIHYSTHEITNPDTSQISHHPDCDLDSVIEEIQ